MQTLARSKSRIDVNLFYKFPALGIFQRVGDNNDVIDIGENINFDDVINDIIRVRPHHAANRSMTSHVLRPATAQNPGAAAPTYLAGALDCVRSAAPYYTRAARSALGTSRCIPSLERG